MSEFKPTPPKLYFDLTKFKTYVKRRKRDMKAEQMLRMVEQTIPPPPRSWTVETFIKEVGFDTEHEEAFAQAFKTWESLMLWDPSAVCQLGGTDASQRAKLRNKVQLFLHGLWPKKVIGCALENFQAPPLKNENKEWRTEDDRELERLVKYYDVTFGNPWLYISWDMQRDVRDVHERYLHKIYTPQVRFHSAIVAGN